MTIRGLTIPSQLVVMIADGRLRRTVGSWPLSASQDYYGHFWESELGQVHQSAREIEAVTERLPAAFPAEPHGIVDEFSTQLGFIPYINDFSHLLEFAISSDGAPFCLDFRNDPHEPSIIWWDDVYWRKVAPSFADFITLFDWSLP